MNIPTCEIFSPIYKDKHPMLDVLVNRMVASMFASSPSPHILDIAARMQRYGHWIEARRLFRNGIDITNALAALALKGR